MTAVRIVHLSDFHFDGSSELRAALARLVDRALDCRPDLVVVSGDLSADGRPAELEAVAAELDRFGPVPRHRDPGNRDLVPSVGPPGEARPLPADSDLDFFLALEPALGFGFDDARRAGSVGRGRRSGAPFLEPVWPARWALFRSRGSRLVAVNSTPRLRSASSSGPPAGCGNAAAGALRVFALHHGLLPVPGRKLRDGDLTARAGDLLALLLELKVDLVLHGHIHRAHAWLVSDGHHQMVVASAGALVNDGRRDASFNEIRVAVADWRSTAARSRPANPDMLFQMRRPGRRPRRPVPCPIVSANRGDRIDGEDQGKHGSPPKVGRRPRRSSAPGSSSARLRSELTAARKPTRPSAGASSPRRAGTGCRPPPGPARGGDSTGRPSRGLLTELSELIAANARAQAHQTVSDVAHEAAQAVRAEAQAQARAQDASPRAPSRLRRRPGRPRAPEHPAPRRADDPSASPPGRRCCGPARFRRDRDFTWVKPAQRGRPAASRSCPRPDGNRGSLNPASPTPISPAARAGDRPERDRGRTRSPAGGRGRAGRGAGAGRPGDAGPGGRSPGRRGGRRRGELGPSPGRGRHRPPTRAARRRVGLPGPWRSGRFGGHARAGQARRARGRPRPLRGQTARRLGAERIAFVGTEPMRRAADAACSRPGGRPGHRRPAAHARSTRGGRADAARRDPRAADHPRAADRRCRRWKQPVGEDRARLIRPASIGLPARGCAADRGLRHHDPPSADDDRVDARRGASRRWPAAAARGRRADRGRRHGLEPGQGPARGSARSAPRPVTPGGGARGPAQRAACGRRPSDTRSTRPGRGCCLPGR